MLRQNLSWEKRKRFVPLHVVRCELAGVVHNHIVSWCDSTLSDMLANQKEVILSLVSGDSVGPQHSPGQGSQDGFHSKSGSRVK